MNGSTEHARDHSPRAAGEFPLAAHLVVSRTFYTHHGIYAGDGNVIHYSRGRVEEVSLAGFSHGRGIRIRLEVPRFDRREVVERARSRLGECEYRLLSNNCEHLCAWALQGESRSHQVDRLLQALRSAWRTIFQGRQTA